jgi:hypothetical protein
MPVNHYDPQSSRFVDQSSKCSGKKRYSKRSHAEAKLLEMSKGRRKGKDMDHMVVYHCPYCSTPNGNAYHLGHSKVEKYKFMGRHQL